MSAFDRRHWVYLLVAAGPALAACGPADRPPAAGYAGTTASAGNAGGGAATSTGGSAGSGGGEAGSAGANGGENPAIVDEPTTACEGTVKSAHTVYPSGAVSPIGSLAPIADGWVSAAVVDSGFMLFDTDGENPTPSFAALASLDRVAPTSDGLLVASISESGVQAARFDLEGNLAGAVASLSTETAYEIEIATVGEQGLVVWSTLSSVRARAIQSDASPVDAAFDLETGIVKDGFSAAIAARGPAGFVVVWSERDPEDRSFTTQLAFADAQGIAGEKRTLLADWNTQRTLALAPMGDEYALLVSHDEAPVVFVLDAQGIPKGSGLRLLGARQAFDLAVVGDEIMVSAVRDDHRDALRRLGPDARPKSGWLCLSDPSTEVEHTVSVSADALGFAAIHRSPGGAQILVRP